jgi:hypothetical protein
MHALTNAELDLTLTDRDRVVSGPELESDLERRLSH